MKISLLQHNIQWNDPTVNMSTVSELLHEITTDLVVLPEMWNTGFVTDPHDTPTADCMEALAFMREQAKSLDAAVIGSMPTLENRNYYNRLYFVRPDGSYDTYDKRHLFSYAGEDKHYVAGHKPLIVEWRGIRIMLQVCYDLRFPVFSRNSSTNSYDLCIYIASWPESRRRVWDTLLQARAIENQCYVAGVNRVGTDSSCKYNGGTQLVDAYGNVVALAEDNTTSIITEPLDMERLQRFRKKFPVLMDGDVFYFKQLSEQTYCLNSL